MKDLNGKVAVITGAGSGLGREFARLGAREGMKLVLADVQREALDAIVAELGGAGAGVIGEVVDVADSGQVAQLAERAFQAFGPVHLLMNNAGVGGGGYLWENTDKDWDWVLGVNLMGVVHGIQHFVPRMLEANRHGTPGHIVNTASMAGWLAAPLMGVYNVSKHAVVALSETLFHDLRLAQSTIGVTALCPAFVPTGIADSHRNRPQTLANPAPPTTSQRMAQAASEKAVSAGRVTAGQVAQLTFEAVRENRFYVFTHPQILPTVQARFEAALHGDAPADPFAGKPSARPASPAG
jgi:NAD(P)-dependent dehydrogenase (short-subunit alcohol dehydrogenase family)